MTPAAELRTAATKLRETGYEPACTPWVMAEQMQDCGLSDAASAWIALASPALAEPIAAAMERAAYVVEVLAPDENSLAAHLIDLARQINGSAS